ncbi:Plasma alpha-L-fucosidase [Folsomia candida]|uniref:Putative alpha-L-fucosidase n=1 Tax=Folsomia candida TaxID=158441 RepID=A0A226DP74_FOLCA|nr:Plasma alpha-L-fucosidase [Folsomia candida]
MGLKLVPIIIAIFLQLSTSQNAIGPSPKVDPTWDSIDARPLPAWYDDGKIGIFIHWGVYSVPSYINAWFWWSWLNDGSQAHDDFMKKNFAPGFSYEEFGPMFTAEFYDPDQWADLFQKSGAKYVVLTSKHHDGYALWPSSHGFAWNSMAVGPKRDLLGDLEQAIRKTEMHFGIYYSLLEWYQPLYVEETANNFTTDLFPTLKSIPTLKEVITKYRPDVVWSDGEWYAPSSYWGALDFLAWLYNDSPVKDTVVTNDRWGSETRGVHGGFYNFDDRYNPGVLIPHKWENAMSLDKREWTHRREAVIEDFLTPEELIEQIVVTVSCGGNILINVGPTKEGTIQVIQQERLLQMGEWLDVNGDAIYNTTPWEYTTSKTDSRIFAMTTSWPDTSILHMGAISASLTSRVEMLGYADVLQWVASPSNGGIDIFLPQMQRVRSKWAWTLVITPP